MKVASGMAVRTELKAKAERNPDIEDVSHSFSSVTQLASYMGGLF